MEMRQVKYFLAVAEEENFSNAARRLNVSQPPITRQIQQLEAELGVQLFERTQKGVKLTAAGGAFLEEARQILHRSRLAVERSRAAARGEIGNLEIGYFGSPIFSVVPRIVRRFCRENSDVSVALHPMTKKAQVEAVKDGRIHIGFGRYYAYDGDIAIEKVAEEGISFAMSATHELASRETLTIDDLKAASLIIFPQAGRPSFADETIRILQKAGIEPKIDFEAADLTSALALSAAGLGVCMAPSSVAELSWPNVCFRTAPDIDAKCPTHCIFLTGDQSPILVRFLEMARLGL